MLCLSIDQHKRQLTVNLRGEDGSVILQRQVSTQWEKVRAFFADLAEKAKAEGGFFAILEVCGMNPWLLAMLAEYGCRETVVIQPKDRSKQKTDRRDAGDWATCCGSIGRTSWAANIPWACGESSRPHPRRPRTGS